MNEFKPISRIAFFIINFTTSNFVCLCKNIHLRTILVFEYRISLISVMGTKLVISKVQ